MTLKEFQTKYPKFVYKSAECVLEGNDLRLSFLFCVEPEIKFSPSVVFKNVPAGVIERLGEPTLRQIAFLLGMAEIPSYWKATCSHEIVIEAGYLDNGEIHFWQDLIKNGMGQFYFENKLPFLTPKFKIKHVKPGNAPIFKEKLSDRFLVPLGGGKDSLVTYELLRQTSSDIATITVQPNQALRNISTFVGAHNIEVSRNIDPKLLELNKQGFLNGHTPFSSVLAFITTAVALIYDFKYVAISQERSSNEGNVKYLGHTVNHQYSKTFDFEKKFTKYIKKHIASEVEYFSFLRPLYELQIAKIFSKYPKYFPIFLSCNKPFTMAERVGGGSGWCGNCPKCLFTFAALYPFIGESETVKIFGKDLFARQELLPVMIELLGEGGRKPFECVGTFEESRAAFYLSWQAAATPRPYLLEYFEENILPKYPNIAKESNNILSSWNSKNNLPKFLNESLHGLCCRA